MKLKKSFWWSTAVMVLVFAVALIVSCKSDDGGGDDGGGQAKWTVMLYGAGNNDLDQANNGTSYIVQDVQDMERVGSQSGMNVIAMVSRFGGGGNARYYHIGQFPNENPNVLSSPELQNLGTKDMSDPQTLRNFLNYCKTNYPADNYQLIIDDHGAGWPGSCSDELSGAGGLLTLPETREAIATSDIGHVDVLTWHACLMSMAEVAYELRTVCDYMTSCQFTMPMENILAADLWLGWLKDNQSAAIEAYAHKVVESVITRAQFKQKTTHYAMIKMSEMQNLGAAIGNFGNILVQEGGANCAQRFERGCSVYGHVFPNAGSACSARRFKCLHAVAVGSVCSGLGELFVTSMACDELACVHFDIREKFGWWSGSCRRVLL
ncbi:MAG: hypothetical protein IPP40_13670 [bacterium]|nr:hypothetical protein [bacterium]